MIGIRAVPAGSAVKTTKEKLRMTPLSQVQARSARLGVALLACAALFVVAWSRADLAQADANEYGIESVSASLSTLEAGRHPDVTTEIRFNPSSEPFATTENVVVDLPPGLTADPQRFPQCPLSVFVTPFLSPVGVPQTPCPQDSQIGLVEIEFVPFPGLTLEEPLYLLSSPEDKVARLGFIGFLAIPYTLEVDLRSESDYGVEVSALHLPSEGPVITPRLIRTKVWGVPASPAHDMERRTPLEAFDCGFATFFAEIEGKPLPLPCAGGTRPSQLPPEPFMSNPASCGPMDFGFKSTSYGLPGQIFSASASAGEIVDCERVPFDPALAIDPTSHRAGDATGLEATLQLPQDEAVNTVNTSPLKGVVVKLPEGMVVNPSAADGLEACSAEQAAFGTRNPADCPDASRLGRLEITSRALKRPIMGGIFLRSPATGHLFRFWLVSNELGVNLKLPAEVVLDQTSGRLTMTIDESPQLPVHEVTLRLNGGARAPLRNPESCGTFDASYRLDPWSGNASATGVVPITIDQGCQTGKFDPKLSAGTISPTAGSFSPFVFDVTREDREQNISSFDLTLPDGLSAKLAGVTLCPEAVASDGNCPADSQVGVVKAAVGAGSQPLWIPQPGRAPTAVYLAGPYKGAPYSVVAAVPAQAGPFDLGVVTVRSGIYVDTETARITVKSDAVPQILQGVPVDYRHVRVEVNRNGFTLNPTSCAVQKIQAVVRSPGGAVASPSDRFQASDCASLGFAPRLSLRLKGGARRGAHPQLRAVLHSRRGQANIRRASVALPHSEFLEQAHIRTVCTRVQFAADSCPSDAIYGHAAVTTPLLNHPLEGPVYLRSSSHKLPDLVLDLRGDIHLAIAGRIDSFNGGIRTIFQSAPDAPFSKLVLNMRGGKRGLLVNSTNLCRSKNFATTEMRGHNGRVSNRRVPLQAVC